MLEEKKYYNGLDLLKIILAIIVVMRHACQSFLEPNSLFYILIVNIISPCAVPCFFIISGFLFFEIGSDIRKQIFRLFVLYAVWSIIYFPLFLLIHRNSGIVDSLKEFIFIGSYYHLWFLPALIVALLINYLLRNISDKVLAIVFLFLFIIAVLSEPYHFLITDTIISKWFASYKKIFLTFRNGVFFAPVYVFIGKQISILNRGNHSQSKKIILFTISLVFLFIEGVVLNNIYHYTVVNILLSCLLFSTMLCLLFIYSSDNHSIKFPIRNISTFLFCSHPLVIGTVLKVFNTIHCNFGVGGGIISLFLSILISWIAVVLSKNKIFKWIRFFY